ncbi:hypothetical protein EVAR_4771_1 [Eumeta japonica]|uniref:Uncharacterized protein n=1 Tax=Eumeta variegata TaxID=151549 RepID=A0A4C1T1N3_EUMVA|nr:hypothetical protein EVAR_4771_1 [Eumeta japonica]
MRRAPAAQWQLANVWRQAAAVRAKERSGAAVNIAVTNWIRSPLVGALYFYGAPDPAAPHAPPSLHLNVERN